MNPHSERSARKIARVDAMLAALMIAVGVAWIWTAQQGALESGMERGHGRDTYGLAILAASIYFPPAALLFGAASWAAFCDKPFHKALHWAAIIWALAPLAWIAVSRALI